MTVLKYALEIDDRDRIANPDEPWFAILRTSDGVRLRGASGKTPVRAAVAALEAADF